MAPGGSENTRLNTHHRQLCLRENYRQFLWIVVFKRERFFKHRDRSAHVWTWQSPCLPACASLWRQPSLKDDDTHAVVAQCVGGLRAWATDMCSSKDAGRTQSETPTLCECEQGTPQRMTAQSIQNKNEQNLVKCFFQKW